MENGIKKCDPNIEFGRIIINSESYDKLVYEKFPANISSKYVMLLISYIGLKALTTKYSDIKFVIGEFCSSLSFELSSIYYNSEVNNFYQGD
ncbi:hypothetical protein HZS_1507 [Henneguya salminicola]|nr:hypothetical protein HZS_1507 [Henneguya salminicola]